MIKKLKQSSQQRKKRQGKRETEQERLKRIAAERKAKPITVQIPEEIVVQELASRLKATVAEVVKKAFLMGTMVTATDTIDFDTASLIAMEFHAKVEKEVVVTIEEQIIDDTEDDDANLVPRAPVVVVMGHVDHGKTSILDVIRHANVTSSEAGGITQHIGAYRVQVNGKDITFLDTPGHEAFTTMRARGAMATDIAILVVAADDGIMPQTVEAINHAKAAGVSVVVAINKMDKPGANPENVKQQLTEYELVPEEWGGDTPCIPVSAKTKEGIPDLLEMVLLIAEMKELKANPDRQAKGCVIEARLDKGRGPIATMLVQNGTLHQGDIVVAGTAVGRVRAMTNDRGRKVKEAGPSVPVEITGLDEVPQGGDIFNAVSDERLARQLVEQRKAKAKEELFNSRTKVTLDNLFDQMKQGEMKELQIIVKADVQGSVEAVKNSLTRLSNDEVVVKVIHAGVGVKEGLAEKALNSVKERLDTKYGVMILQPAYTEYHLELGEVSSYPPGYKENAGIFCHNNPWVSIAETVLGRGDRAFEIYRKTCPAYIEDISEIHRTEPYVYSQMVAGKDAKFYGEAKNSWLTGTAAWTFVNISQYILGVYPTHQGLSVDPCIPKGFGDFSITRKFREGTYHIQVKNPQNVEKGVVSMTVDGKAVDGHIIPYEKGKEAYDVVITMG